MQWPKCEDITKPRRPKRCAARSSRTCILTHVNGYPQSRQRAHAQAALRFFDIRRLARELDDDQRHETSNYNESEDEDLGSAQPTDSAMAVDPNHLDNIAAILPGDDASSELNLDSREVRELLADAPIPVKSKHAPEKLAVPDMEVDEVGGSFELGAWV